LRTEEHAAEQAIEQFEESKRGLYRKDGSRRYSDADNDERIEALTAELREKIEGLIERAEKDAVRHEEEALHSSYTDPTKGLISTELSRLDTLRPLVAEDCERMPAGEIQERLRAVGASNDTVAKTPHARNASFRAQAMEEELDAAASSSSGERSLPEAYNDSMPAPRQGILAQRIVIQCPHILCPTIDASGEGTSPPFHSVQGYAEIWIWSSENSILPGTWVNRGKEKGRSGKEMKTGPMLGGILTVRLRECTAHRPDEGFAHRPLGSSSAKGALEGWTGGMRSSETTSFIHVADE
jgi:hypothetical protein